MSKSQNSFDLTSFDLKKDRKDVLKNQKVEIHWCRLIILAFVTLLSLDNLVELIFLSLKVVINTTALRSPEHPRALLPPLPSQEFIDRILTLFASHSDFMWQKNSIAPSMFGLVGPRKENKKGTSNIFPINIHTTFYFKMEGCVLIKYDSPALCADPTAETTKWKHNFGKKKN